MSYTKEQWIIGVTYDNGWPVFRLRDMEDPKNPLEVQADADLMQAAPELLKACKKMMEAWIQPTARSMHQLRTDMDKAYEQAKSAISTAEGKEQA